MPAPENRVKSAMKAGHVQFGLWLASANPTIAEIASRAGFDWCLIDGEHAPTALPLVLAQLQAMAGGDAAVAMRLPVGDVRLVKQALDLGLQTLLIPMVNTAEQAREMVRATRYPPHGIRGVGAAMARATSYGANTDYLPNACDQICLIVQAETVEALDNLDDIAAVDGVDCVFLGPADLAASLGHLGNTGHPEVQDAIRDAVRRIKAAGKAVGLITFDEAAIAGLVELGGDFIAVGGDIALLAHAIHRRAETAQSLKPR
ncbi:2-keto-3-deoxy-L-rhamnonate aldolase [Maribius pontilimi]|uniref:Hydroxypyruvate/pyruvate aldolase n=1 Tax=Palleronia pontilimi TaxID=1964209 RepID=A0A934MCQ2_9RHOB|nr:aldolase/citrate lyase family protein [Palleronia pontilimi]MBJ3763038.1 2-keto-3-deoxy-L-rhamnonate aldolase [Palleronia pontilimi]